MVCRTAHLVRLHRWITALTVRTQMALTAVGDHPGLNNREVSEIIDLADQGQISRMIKRLQTQGLVENAQGHTSRQIKAWRLTAEGEAVIDAHRPLKQAQRTPRTRAPNPRRSARSRGNRNRCARRPRPGHGTQTGSPGYPAARPPGCDGQPPVSRRRRTCPTLPRSLAKAAAHKWYDGSENSPRRSKLKN